MDYRTLGRTGLKVSVMGLGAGGPSRLGQREGDNSEAQSVALIQQALDHGVNFIDTAEAYKTEHLVGQAMAGRDRTSIILSTKKSTGGNPITPQDVRDGLESSLQRLNTDYIDIYHLHGVAPGNYAHCRKLLVPVLQDLQQQGKIRFLGVTEAWNSDTTHDMLVQALEDDVWDVMMVGFNILNQTARERVLRPAMTRNTGILVMFAIRLALSREERLREVIRELVNEGQLDPAEFDADNPLRFVLDHAPSLADAAYRFCRDEPGTHVILSGTGNPAHLQANFDTFGRPPLPGDVVEKLKFIFRRVDSVTGQ